MMAIRGIYVRVGCCDEGKIWARRLNGNHLNYQGQMGGGRSMFFTLWHRLTYPTAHAHAHVVTTFTYRPNTAWAARTTPNLIIESLKSSPAHYWILWPTQFHRQRRNSPHWRHQQLLYIAIQTLGVINLFISIFGRLQGLSWPLVFGYFNFRCSEGREWGCDGCLDRCTMQLVKLFQYINGLWC